MRNFRWGFVYFIFQGRPSLGRCKIGQTIQKPMRRLRQLQTGSAYKLHLHGVIKAPEPEHKKLEKKLHYKFAHRRIRGEWFKITPDEVDEIIEEYSDKIIEEYSSEEYSN